jgi:hypothetical protein
MKFTAKQLALMGMLITLNVAIGGIVNVVCTENLIRVDDATESPKLVE